MSVFKNKTSGKLPEDVIADAIKPSDEPSVTTHGYGDSKTVTKGDTVYYNGFECRVTLVHPEGFVDVEEIAGVDGNEPRWFGRIAPEAIELTRSR
jgi:signal peptidase I